MIQFFARVSEQSVELRERSDVFRKICDGFIIVQFTLIQLHFLEKRRFRSFAYAIHQPCVVTVYAQGDDLRSAPARFIAGKPALIGENCARRGMEVRLFLLVFSEVCLKRRCTLAHIMYKSD